MDTNVELGQLVPLFIATVSAVGAIYAAFVAARSPAGQSAAIESLSNSVKSLNNALDDERAARKKDKAFFQDEIKKKELLYEAKYQEMSVRIQEVENLNRDLIMENHSLRKKLDERN